VLALVWLLVPLASVFGTSSLPYAVPVAQEVPYQSVTESDRLYHEDRAKTIRGVVQETRTITLKDNALFSRLHLKTAEDQVVPVHLGPSWFMEENEHLLDLNVGREVEVKGSFETIAGQPVFVAAQILNDRREEGMRLRREDGMPAWVGGEYLP
jgi:hypothetical protein